MSDSGPAGVLRLVLELWREQGRLMARVRSPDPPADYGVVALHELTLLLEAVAADAEP